MLGKLTVCAFPESRTNITMRILDIFRHLAVTYTATYRYLISHPMRFARFLEDVLFTSCQSLYLHSQHKTSRTGS